MIRYTRVKHKFVHHIPETVEPGVLYVSVDFATAVHSCCCGCGKEVVTPLAPSGWKLVFDGETVSLAPSIGNRNFECKSHYFIMRNRVIEAKPWDNEDETPITKDNREKGGTGTSETGSSDDANSKGWRASLQDWVADSRMAKLNRKPKKHESTD